MSNGSRLTWAALTLALLGIFLSLRSHTVQRSPKERREGTLQKVLEQKKLRVGYITYPPTAFRDPATGEMRGHFVDTLKEIVRQLDPSVEILYEETTWADFTAALNAGRFDLSIAGTFATIPRAKQVTFTRPLVYLARSAVVRKGDTRFAPDRKSVV